MKASTDEIFPPTSTTIDHLKPDGSDRKFRQTIYGLLSVSAMMLRTRELYGNYIGVTAPQYSILMAIAEDQAATVGQLSTKLHTSGPYITSEVNKLVQQGLVSRQRSEEDRRSSFLKLTPLGKERVMQVSPMRTSANDIIFGSLNSAEAAMLHHLLAVMVRDFEKAIHELEGPRWRPVSD